MEDFSILPPNLPAPEDDGLARHLTGARLPCIPLAASDGSAVDLSALSGRAVVFAYPRTGRPGEPPLVPSWDLIPGARGCTSQVCGFRNLEPQFQRHGCRVFGLSTQVPEYQRELAGRLELPFLLLSDARLRFANTLRLPKFAAGGQKLLKRLVWIQVDGTIERVFYPVFPPDQSAQEVLSWLTRLYGD